MPVLTPVRRLFIAFAIILLSAFVYSATRAQTYGFKQQILSSLGLNASPKAVAAAPNAVVAMQGPVANPGSVLVFPYYTSTADATSNTLVTINNGGAQAATLHIFYVVGCTITDSFATVAANASRTFSMAVENPGQTGYLIAVAVDSGSRPIQENNFTGQATLNDGDYAGTYDAEVFKANSPTPATINSDGTATLHFDGAGYDQVASKFMPMIKSSVDVAGQKVVTAGLSGNMTTGGTLGGAKQIGTGLVRANTGRLASFTNFMSTNCHSSGIINDRLPRVPSGMNFIVPTGETATVEFNIGGGVGLFLTPQTAPGGAKILPLAKVALTNADLTIPVQRPAAVPIPVSHAPGSILVFPYYTSGNAPNDTTIGISNVGAETALIHLFFINDCSQYDSTLVLAPYGCASLKTSEYDPFSTGYLLAIAVNNSGAPIQYNNLRGQAILKDGDYHGIYDAEAFKANSASPATIDTTLYKATLNFDGTGYDQLPNRFSANIQSPVDVVGQRIITAGLKGDFNSGTGTGGGKAGVGTATTSTGQTASYTNFLTSSCFNSEIISASNPQVARGFDATVPTGVTAVMDFVIGGGVGLQLTPSTAPGGAKIQPLTKNGLTNGTLTIPISFISDSGSGSGSPAKLSIDDVTVAEGNSGTTNAVFTVLLTGLAECAVTVNYDLPASPTGDYNATSGILVFSGSTTMQTISVPINGDVLVEGNEQLAMTLSNPFGAIIEKAIGAGTITNDDIASLGISSVSVVEGNSGNTNAVFQVSLSAAVDQAVSLTVATADGAATQASGDYVSASQVITFPAGAAATIPYTVVVKGDTFAELNETFLVNLLPGTLPAGVTVANSFGTGTIINDDLSLNINDAAMVEGDSGVASAIFTVSLSNASPTPVTVNYATANSSATVADNDYAATSGTVTFPAGSLTQAIIVPVNGDTTLEANETFFVRLSSPVGAAILDGEGAGTITNDDSSTLSINDVTIAEGNGGTTLAVFTLNLSKPISTKVDVQATVLDSTAIMPSDYANLSGVVSFSPGSSSQTIAIPINGDSVVEANETFSVSLSIITGHPDLSITKGVGIGSITNDDAGSVAIENVTMTEGNSGSMTAIFNVSLNGVVDQPVSINYATADAIATTAGIDYTAKSGSLTFPAFSTNAQTIEVSVTGDSLAEINETFKVQLTPNSLPYVEVTVPAEPGIGTILNDDVNTVPTSTVVPLAVDVITTFSAVQGGGVTVATPIAPPTAEVLPAGFVVDGLNRAYEINTTATFTGPVVVTFKAPDNISPEQFALLRVLHGESGVLVDRTILAPESPAPNYATREISARVNSFSPFILAVSATPEKRPNISPGSILVFPYYTSKTSAHSDTRMTLSNVGTQKANVHLFFVDGATCNQSDFFACLSANASLTINSSEYDSETTGWLMAVAVDANGNPIQNNCLIGNAFVNDGDYFDSYTAETFWAATPAVAVMNGDGTATLRFDGNSYEQVPNSFAVEIQSPLSAIGQKIVTVGMSGDLTQGTLTGAAQSGIGVVYNGDEKAASFSPFLNGKCQAVGILTNSSPRIPGTLGSLIPKGRVGTIRFTTGGGLGLLMTPKSNKWSGIRGLHKTGLTSTSLTIPVLMPPAC